jgi:hypothetical protein
LPLLSVPPRNRIGLQAVRRHGTARLVVAKGQDQLWVLGTERGNDTRCRQCGSLLFSVVRNGAFVHVALGSLADQPSIRPTEHIFVGSKAGWSAIVDDLPQYAALAGDGPPIA